ncbi:MAG: hypothetical protein GWN00_04030 [Aliifodinibius sp.]|nr:hypothetical protein [Fodinibius sp.]NIW98558.1 hypothetical protein [Phycisphaerae bacterium]NIY24003.1 hypothetical protein [Fodinibius sp.]
MGEANYDSTPTLATYMTNGLDGLADNTTNVGGTIFDNSSNLDFYMCAELVLNSVDLSSETNPTVELYMVPSIDGTNYCDTGSDASSTDIPPASTLAGIFIIQETNASHRAGIEMFRIGPLKYTPVIINKTGQAFHATTNTLKMGTFSETTA